MRKGTEGGVWVWLVVPFPEPASMGHGAGLERKLETSGLPSGGPSARGTPKGQCLAWSRYLIWAPVVACGHRSVLGGRLFLFMVVGQLVFWSGSRQLAAFNLQPLFPRSVPCKQGP